MLEIPALCIALSLNETIEVGDRHPRTTCHSEIKPYWLRFPAWKLIIAVATKKRPRGGGISWVLTILGP